MNHRSNHTQLVASRYRAFMWASRWCLTLSLLFAICLVPRRSEAARDDILATFNPDGVAQMVINDFPIDATIVQGSVSLQTDDAGCVGLPTHPCNYVVNVLRTTLSGFTFSGKSVTDTVAIINGPIAVVDVGEGLTIPAGTPVVVALTVDGERQTVNSTSPSGVNIMLDVADQQATVTGTFVGSLDNVSVNAALLATAQSPFRNLPPVANAGPDQTVMCGAPAHLDGSATSDPNNNLLLLSWSEAGTALGVGAVVDVTLAPGVHDVLLEAFDTFEGRGTDTTIVTVIPDTEAPVFAPIEEAKIADCSAPDLGKPVVTDNCGVVSLTNDAPAVFPLGCSIVTWTAVDAAGNKATATQEVFAQLGDDPSCCPPGTNIIVGTAGRDLLKGTKGSDCILGRGGDDLIFGLGGNDFLSGGAGNDKLFGGPPHGLGHLGESTDYLAGGAGRDVCIASPESTFLSCEEPERRRHHHHEASCDDSCEEPHGHHHHEHEHESSCDDDDDGDL
jgi:hypothetical protein